MTGLELFAGMGVFVLFGSILVAFGLSARLQQPISGPIRALAETAHQIAERKDYSVRATSIGRDETGLLTTAFNQMLDGIQERERALTRGERIPARRKLPTANTCRRPECRRIWRRLELLNQITRADWRAQKSAEHFSGGRFKNLEEHLPVHFCVYCLLRSGRGTLTVASASGIASRNAGPPNWG